MPLNDPWLSGRSNAGGLSDEFLAYLRSKGTSKPERTFNAWVDVTPKPPPKPKPPKPVKPPKWPHDVECLVCHVPFAAYNSTQVRCPPCQANSRMGRSGKHTKRVVLKGAPVEYTCEVCGKLIIGSAKLVRVTCSPECHATRWNAVRRERWKVKHAST